jgi:hypothetical protein
LADVSSFTKSSSSDTSSNANAILKSFGNT